MKKRDFEKNRNILMAQKEIRNLDEFLLEHKAIHPYVKHAVMCRKEQLLKDHVMYADIFEKVKEQMKSIQSKRNHVQNDDSR